MTDLADVIASWRADAIVLRRNGQALLAKRLDDCAEAVEQSAAEWLTWLSESDAMLRSGRSRDWLRAQFSAWEREGHATLQGRNRMYRAVIVPRSHSVNRARQAGAEAARLVREGKVAS